MTTPYGPVVYAELRPDSPDMLDQVLGGLREGDDSSQLYPVAYNGTTYHDNFGIRFCSETCQVMISLDFPDLTGFPHNFYFAIQADGTTFATGEDIDQEVDIETLMLPEGFIQALNGLRFLFDLDPDDDLDMIDGCFLRQCDCACLSIGIATSSWPADNLPYSPDKILSLICDKLRNLPVTCA